MRTFIASLGIGAIALLGGANVVAQDDPVDPPVTVEKLFAGTRLLPPEGAANLEAAGSAKLLQWGERMAIHVGVRHLDPGATYDVVATKTISETESQDAALGTITTHDGSVPDPTVFKACLRVPPPPPEGVEGAGDAPKHLRHRTWQPTALAIFKLNEEKTEASFDFYVMGGTLTAASVVYPGDPVVPVALTLDEENEGTVTVNADQLAALKAGTAAIAASVTVKDSEGVETIKELTGTLKPLFQRFFEFFAARRAGTGALRLDTERGDAMPFGVTTIRDLAGVKISVKDSTGAVVLAGTIGEVLECIRPDRRKDLMDGLSFTGDDSETLAYADSRTFFSVGERHDASFVRGDANDDGICDLADSIHVLLYLYGSGTAPYSPDAADANDSGSVDLSDAIGILTTLFQGATLPGPAGRAFDTSVDELSCAAN